MKRIPILLALLLGSVPLLARQTTFTGTLLGNDGRPMPAAHVHLLRSGGHSPLISAAASADGKFTLATDAMGMLELQFTGANHQSHNVRILVDAPREIALDVRLGTYLYPKDFDNVMVIGDFNDFAFETGHPMVKGKDGIYSATFKTSKPAFTYQLLFPLADGTGARSMNGTASDSYVYDGGGDYRSVLTPKKGRVTVTFDPSKLAQSPAEAHVVYRDRLTSRLAEVMTNIDDREKASIDAIRQRIREGKDLSDFSYDWSSEMARLTDQIGRETDPTIHAALMLSYVWLEHQGATNLDSAIAQRALKEIPPTSLLWGMTDGLLGTTIQATNTPDAYEDYRWSVIKNNADSNVVRKALFSAVENVDYEKQPERFMGYYNYLEKTYAGTFEAGYAKAEYSPARAIKVGNTIPAFSMSSLDTPGTIISNESMKGKVYLIDFWATWCGPCVSEMSNLHNAYEKYHAKNFEIVSFSFDRAPAAIAKFRNGTWKMPWLHAFVDGGFNSDLAARFEVMGIPKPMLVDADGHILATENALRGPALDRTLARVLGDKDVSSK